MTVKTLEILLIILCWVIFFLYWIVSSKKTKAVKEVGMLGGNILWLLGIVLLFMLLSWLGPAYALPEVFLDIEILLVVIGTFLALWSRKALALNWSKDAALIKEQQLITNGPYRFIRHPIYTGFLFMSFGTALFTEKYLVVILPVIFLLFLGSKLTEEEKLLEKEFGDEYGRYKSKTKALIPFIW